MISTYLTTVQTVAMALLHITCMCKHVVSYSVVCVCIHTYIYIMYVLYVNHSQYSYYQSVVCRIPMMTYIKQVSIKYHYNVVNSIINHPSDHIKKKMVQITLSPNGSCLWHWFPHVNI